MPTVPTPVAAGDALPALLPDQQTVYDGLAFLQSPCNITRLAEFLGGERTARGTQFHGVELRRLLGELKAKGLVDSTPQGPWLALQPRAWQRLRHLCADAPTRGRWWAAWRRLYRFDHAWYLEMFGHETLVGAIRVVVLADGSEPAFERLVQLSRQLSPESPALLAQALLEPFESAVWDAMQPGLRRRLLNALLMHLDGDSSTLTRPLWHWLQARSAPDPAALETEPRLRLANHLLLAGQREALLRLLLGLDHPEAQALRAAADIAEGHHASGTQAFELAWREAAAQSGRRKQLFALTTSWFHALGLIAQPDPGAWTRARKFAAGESGKREADPDTLWGVWQEAIDQRLGDRQRDARVFWWVSPPGQRVHALVQLTHWLLAAWLGHRAPDARMVGSEGQRVAADYEAAGLPWLAWMTRRSVALLCEQPAEAADLAATQAPFPIAPPADLWREALSAIVALGAMPGHAAAAPEAGPDRLVWTVDADALGRVRRIEPLEQKAGTRGYGKPKAVSLAALIKRSDLPAHDAAVLRAVKKLPYGGRLTLDKTQALQSLVGHPAVAWADAPLEPVEVAEGLPQLEVLTRGEHLQFKVLDPIRPADAQPGDEDDDLDDDERSLRPGRPAGPAGKPPVLLFKDGPAQARLVRVTPAQLRVAELVSQGWQVPVAARAELDAALRVLATHFQLASDADAGHEVPATAVLRAELTPQGEGLALKLLAAPFGDFGPRMAPGQGRERVTTVHQGITLSARRDLATEAAHRQLLLERVDWLDDAGHGWSIDAPDQALALVEALAGLGEAIVTEWPKGKPVRVRPVAAPQLALRVNSQGDWLQLDGELQVDGGELIRLQQLLQLLQPGQRRYVALGEGDFLALSDTLRQQLADLRSMAQAGAEGPRLSALAALAWSAQADAPALAGDLHWQQRCEAWAAAQQQAFALPAALAAELRDYQHAGYTWLMRLAAGGFGALLADDMGLGKTLQTLAVLVARADGGPALVVAPTSVVGNWLAEAARFAPGLELQLYGDTAAEADPAAGPATEATPAVARSAAAKAAFDADADADAEAEAEAEAEADPEADADSPTAEPAEADSARRAARRRQVQALGPQQVLLVSYGLLQQDADILTARPWHTAVLDEAQAIKNPGTRRAKAAHALSAQFKLALSGTPVENRLGELWSIMAFANPGLLGSAEQFNQRFAGPIEREADPLASRRLKRLVAPFLLRRTKTEVLADLPPRTEIVHTVVPGSRERALLEALRQQAQASVAQALEGAGSPGQAQMHVLAALTRLRRAACDPRLVVPELGLVGAKVQEFERLAQELVAGRHKALVFSQFTDFLALLRERLEVAGLAYQYLDGSTPAAQRSQRVAAFQRGEGDFFLISLKAGGFGLNLTMADYVIIADPWWNPAAEDQASGRAHRMGQQRPVTVYRLVTQGSIEDRIVALHHHKRALADGVLAAQEGDEAAPLVMDAAQLMALLRGED